LDQNLLRFYEEMFDQTKALLFAIAETVLWVVLFSLPILIVTATIVYRRRSYKAEAKEPFTDLPLRPPGESSRLKGEEFAEDAFAEFVFLAAVCSLAGLTVALTSPQSRPETAGVTGIGLAALSFILVPRILRRLRKFWDYRLGSIGEQLVGEELSQLLASGYRVFHDVPFENFNIDHVVVGAPGVFVIETKTYRKRTNNRAKTAVQVVFDGRSLSWPWGQDNRPLDQAERNARSVSDWLSRATGESVLAKPILTVPGWWIQRSKKYAARMIVVSSKGLHRFFPTTAATPIPAAQVRRIIHLLTERCRPARPKQS
jgi:Nuclease-related domain